MTQKEFQELIYSDYEPTSSANSLINFFKEADLFDIFTHWFVFLNLMQYRDRYDNVIRIYSEDIESYFYVDASIFNQCIKNFKKLGLLAKVNTSKGDYSLTPSIRKLEEILNNY